MIHTSLAREHYLSLRKQQGAFQPMSVRVRQAVAIEARRQALDMLDFGEPGIRGFADYVASQAEQKRLNARWWKFWR